MDPLSHALVGAAVGSLSRSPDPVLTQAAYWAAIAGGVSPDADWVVRWFGGEMAYLREHRGWTHALPGLIGIPLVIALVVHWFFPTAPLGALFLWALAGALSHVFLDITNSYGTMSLLPWSRRKLALDITMLVDLPILGLIGAAMVWTRLHPAQRVPAFSLALAVALLYLAGRYRLHRYLVDQAWRRFAEQHPKAISVMPGIVGVRSWSVLVETQERYLVGEVRVPGPIWSEFRPLDRGPDDEAVAAAQRHPYARIFLEFARHPRVSVRRAGGRTYVTWGDLRFLFRDRPVFTLTVVLDRQNRPVDARLGRGFRNPAEKGGASA